MKKVRAPEGYIERSEWMQRSAAQGHRQTRCPDCRRLAFDHEEHECRRVTVYKSDALHVGGCNGCPNRGTMRVLNLNGLQVRLCALCVEAVRAGLDALQDVPEPAKVRRPRKPKSRV